MVFIASLLNLFSSYLIACLSGNFLVIFISFFALIVLNLEILSLFNAIKDINIIIFNFVLFAFSIILFKIKKAKFIKPNFDFKRLANSLLLDKSLILLFSAYVFMLLVMLFLASFMPVLEPDSQTYHFLRAYQFVKYHSLNHFETNDIRALIMSINSEILYAYFFALKKNLYGYGLITYFSYLLTICSMWSICDYLKIAFRKRLWAIFVFSSLAGIIIHMSSMQTDLIVGGLLLCTLALYFKKQIYFSSLALALAFGVKSTGPMSIIGIMAFLFAFEFLINKKPKTLIKFISFLTINFLIFSSYNYFSNLIHYGNPFANNAALIGHSFWVGFKGYFTNLTHYFFQSFDFTGFKWGFYLNAKILAFKQAFLANLGLHETYGCNVPQEIVNITTDEQVVGYGILGFLIFLPMIFISSVKTFFTKNKRVFILGLCGLMFLINILVLARSIAFMVFSTRFIATFICLSFIVLTLSYKKRSFLKPFIIFFCLFYMILISTHIKRMPFNWIRQNLEKVNYNVEAFTQDCYQGKIIEIFPIAPEIMQTIQEKFSDCKKIALLKSVHSSVLYLTNLEKNGHTLDFLNPAKINKEELKQYDLIITENEMQQDNTFRMEDVEFNYTLDNQNNVRFINSDILECWYINLAGAITLNPKAAIERTCFTVPFLQKSKDFKQVYKDVIDYKKANSKYNIYYFKPY